MRVQCMVFAIATLVVGCQGRDLYSPGEVMILSVRGTEDGVVELEYATPLETLYVSPGVRLEVGPDELKVGVVRCSAKNPVACKVDVAASSLSSPHVVRFRNPGGRSVVLTDGEVRRPVPKSVVEGPNSPLRKYVPGQSSGCGASCP